jgi:hypothetical protein
VEGVQRQEKAGAIFEDPPRHYTQGCLKLLAAPLRSSLPRKRLLLNAGAHQRSKAHLAKPTVPTKT